MRSVSVPGGGGLTGALRSRRLLALAGDERLVEQIRRGNEAAFEVVYERYSRGLLGFCRHMLRSPEEAEEAVQHAFAAAYRDLLRDDRPIALKPWLYTIARNRCLSILRARPPQPEEEQEIATAGLDEQVQGRSELRELLADVARLPDDQRAALLLAEVGGLSQAEVAEVLGCEVQSVKALVFRARSGLMKRKEARETPCSEIREQLANLRGGSLRRGELRHHLSDCPGCRSYRDELREQRQMLAAALPVMPSAALKTGVLGSVGLGSGAGGAGGAIGGGVVGGGAAGGGATVGGGAGVGGGAPLAGLGGSVAMSGGLSAAATGPAGSAAIAGALAKVAVAGGLLSVAPIATQVIGEREVIPPASKRHVSALAPTREADGLGRLPQARPAAPALGVETAYSLSTGRAGSPLGSIPRVYAPAVAQSFRSPSGAAKPATRVAVGAAKAAPGPTHTLSLPGEKPPTTGATELAAPLPAAHAPSGPAAQASPVAAPGQATVPAVGVRWRRAARRARCILRMRVVAGGELCAAAEQPTPALAVELPRPGAAGQVDKPKAKGVGELDDVADIGEQPEAAARRERRRRAAVGDREARVQLGVEAQERHPWRELEPTALADAPAAPVEQPAQPVDEQNPQFTSGQPDVPKPQPAVVDPGRLPEPHQSPPGGRREHAAGDAQRQDEVAARHASRAQQQAGLVGPPAAAR